ncbi:UpxY family transcription antiterminator [Chryseobacterium sp. c4a]|uniref:UpxY family transcription antiterminator n=1 Tax=Chryseobacterium sp. c4a TaxID=1573582 RepID=UPI00135864C9|nr:UpxY family transcription antiterminator [Chryseobacterium sp. c4a]
MAHSYLGWYVLYVKFQHEKKINHLLREMNFDSFLPTFEVSQRWSDRKKIVNKPLFPSYVFLNVRTKNEFFKALEIDGVFNYISFGGKYAKIRDSEILTIKKFITDSGISNVETSVNLPKVGELVKINSGALEGLTCEVIKIENERRIFVYIESLKLNISAIVPSNYLI